MRQGASLNRAIPTDAIPECDAGSSRSSEPAGAASCSAANPFRRQAAWLWCLRRRGCAQLLTLFWVPEIRKEAGASWREDLLFPGARLCAMGNLVDGIAIA